MTTPHPHHDLIRQGAKAWNELRKEDPSFIPKLRGVDLSGADLSKANLAEAVLTRANLAGANLRKAYFGAALLCDADLRGAKLADADLNYADLSRANLSRAELSDANLMRANLSAADLSGAELRAAHLNGAYLNGADLKGADLRQASLALVNFRGADLTEANLSGASLIGADLSEANLSSAQLSNTIFARTNLTNTIGLNTCKHKGPSVLDHFTFALSGHLPTLFLRGCGLPDTFIEYLPSLFNQAIQFYSCFISYSTKDQSFADRLYADLQNKGVRCWFAPHDIQGGKKLHEQIDEAIRVYDRLLVILSHASMDSEWVKTELAKARKRERKEERRMLFPVRLVDFDTLLDWECFDADTGKDSAREIREFYVPDFSNWKDHDAYQKEFDKLLRGLKTESKSPPGT